MRHVRGFVRGISVLGVLLFLAASLSAQPPTGTPVQTWAGPPLPRGEFS